MLVFPLGFILIEKNQWQIYECILLNDSIWYPFSLKIIAWNDSNHEISRFLDPECDLNTVSKLDEKTPEEIRDFLVNFFQERTKLFAKKNNLKIKKILVFAYVRIITVNKFIKKPYDNDNYCHLDLPLEVFSKVLPGDKLILSDYQLKQKEDFHNLIAGSMAKIDIQPLVIPKNMVYQEEILGCLEKFYSYMGPIGRDDEIFPSIINRFKSGYDIIITSQPKEVVPKQGYSWNDEFQDINERINLIDELIILEKSFVKSKQQKQRIKEINQHLDKRIEFFEDENRSRLHRTAQYSLYIRKKYGLKPYFVGDDTLGEKIRKL